MKLTACPIVIFISLLLAGGSNAQNSFKPSYDLKSISSNSEISSLEITVMFQDSDGFIWLGTKTGISKYDGVNFKNYNFSSGRAIDNIYAITEDNKERIWAAGENGLFFYDGLEFRSTSINKEVITTLLIDQLGNLLIGGTNFIPFSILTEEYDRLLKGDEISRNLLIDAEYWRNNLKDKRVWKITEDDEGNIWMGLDNILGRVNQDTLISIWENNDINIQVSDINAINPDSVYWGSQTLGLRKKIGEKVELIMDVYTYISSRTDTSLIFLTTKDLIKITPEGRDTISDLSGFDHLYFRAMLQDREGNLWIAAEGNLLKLSTNYFQSWSIKSNILLRSNSSIFETDSGQILIGSSKKDILEWNGSTFERFCEIPATYNSMTEGINEDRNGDLWFATSMSGLIRKSNNGFIQLDESTGLPDKTLMFVREDAYGRLWSGGEKGISQIISKEEKVISTNFFSKEDPVVNQLFFTVLCPSEKDCYAISNKNIYSIKKNYLERVTIVHHREIPIISGAIVDRVGNLLVSTLGGGILRLERNELGAFAAEDQWTTKDGLLSDFPLNLHLDQNDRIWTFSNNGTCIIERSLTGNRIRCFSKEDGWPPLATTHIDLLESKDKYLWVVANTTITRFPLYDMPTNHIAPQTYINQVQLFDGRENIEKYNQSSSRLNDYNLVLPYNKNFLRFNFVSTSYTHNEKNKFTYKLEGLDETWSDPTTSSFVSYPGLKPGKYVFKVLAFNNSGVRGATEAAYPFLISRPWYLKWWAILAYLLIFASIIYTFYKLRLNRRRKENEAIKLKELNEFQSEFYTNITHEFRTPLTVILGMAEKLSVDEDMAQMKDSKKALEMIQRNGNSLLKLINEMLDMSKLESGNLKLQLIQGDVSSFIKYNLESLKSLATIKHIDLVCYNEEHQLVMDYDEEKLGFIITNLVSNAIKYSNAGDQIIVHVKSEKIAEGLHLFIKIKDEGDGIAQEDLLHIFKRFYKASNSRKFEGEGSGIGLALTKELVNLMSGKITVKSEVGVGTEFLVILPITNQAALTSNSRFNLKANGPIEMNISEKVAKSYKLHSEIALIVEDNSDVAAYIISCLENKYETLHAADGQEGIEMAVLHQPDIIICDVMMPRKNGFEVCENLKNNIATDHIPIILLTARVDMKDRISGFSSGADAYLTKPFSKVELFTRIDQLILTRSKLLDKLSKSGIDVFMRKKLMDPDAVFIQKAVKHINENLDNTIFGPAFLAKKILISESQLYRKLKAITGKSTALFIRSIRLQKAKELLQNEEFNISQVAYEVGFSNPSWFSTAFKEEFGYSPSEMKES